MFYFHLFCKNTSASVHNVCTRGFEPSTKLGDVKIFSFDQISGHTLQVESRISPSGRPSPRDHQSLFEDHVVTLHHWD